jgi:hypothetical protein
MINRQNPSERAQLKEGSDALDGARVATPAISDFYNNICHKPTSPAAQVASGQTEAGLLAWQLA